MSQSRSQWWQSLPAVFALAAGVAAWTTLGAQSSDDKWWPGYGGSADNSRYFASRQISKSNVGQLQVAWTYPFGDTGFGPVAVRGTIYGRGRNGSLVAVDAKTGRELWVRENMAGMTSRGLNYWASADGSDERLIFAMDSLLQALDAKTGRPIMSFGTGGVVDLRVGIDGREPASIGNIQGGSSRRAGGDPGMQQLIVRASNGKPGAAAMGNQTGGLPQHQAVGGRRRKNPPPTTFQNER
jgi:quinoprotein glucose dehydrogenase